MRFITEHDLRTMYKKSPFNVYKISKNCRLTPGAKQFLTDFLIKIEDVGDEKSLPDKKIEVKEKDLEYGNEACLKKLSLRIKSLAIKANKVNQIVAEKLNSIAISLYQGLVSFSESCQLPEKAYEKLIYIDLDDFRLDFYLALLELDLELESRIKEIRTCIKNTEDQEIQNEYNDELKFLNGLRFTLYRIIKEEQREEDYLC